MATLRQPPTLRTNAPSRARVSGYRGVTSMSEASQGLSRVSGVTRCATSRAWQERPGRDISVTGKAAAAGFRHQ